MLFGPYKKKLIKYFDVKLLVYRYYKIIILGFHENMTHPPGSKKHVSIMITLFTIVYNTVGYVCIFNYLKITNSQYSDNYNNK